MGNGRIGGFSSPFGSTGIHIGGWHRPGGGNSSDAGPAPDPTPEELTVELDKLSAANQIPEIKKRQEWSAQHPHGKGMRARLQRIRLDEFLADRLQKAYQQLNQSYIPVHTGLQRQHRPSQVAVNQQPAVDWEAVRRAEAAAQAAAENVLEETARLTAEVAVAERAVQTATLHVTQLEAQLVTAQAATQDAMELKSTCAQQRAEAVRTLETANERVSETLAHYMPILDEAKKQAAITVSEQKKSPRLNTPAFTAADRQLSDSNPIRTAARIAAEHAKLQQTTALDLQKSIEELAQLTHQHATTRATAEDQTRLAVEQATKTTAHLTSQLITTQQAAQAAADELKIVIHRLSSQQQTTASNRAHAAAQMTEKPMVFETPVDETLSRELTALTTRLRTTQEKITQTNQALVTLSAMEAEAQRHKTIDELISQPLTRFSNTLQTLMQEYLLLKELAELQLENNPLSEILAHELSMIAEAKQVYQTTNTPDKRIKFRLMGSYHGELALAYQGLLQRKADTLAQQTQRDLALLSRQKAALTETLQHLMEAGENPIEIEIAPNHLAELTPRLMAAEQQAQEALKEAVRLAEQDTDAKQYPEVISNIYYQKRAFLSVHSRGHGQYAEQYKKRAEDLISPANVGNYWAELYGKELERQIDNHSIKKEIISVVPTADNGYPHRAALQATAPSPSSFKSLELLFKYGFDGLTSDEDTALHLDDKSLNLATRLFMWDLLCIMIYHAPMIHQTPSIIVHIPEKSLHYMQQFFTTHPERYQTALSRMSKRLQPELDSTQTQTHETASLFDRTIHQHGHLSLSGGELAESAQLALQMKAKFAQKRNQRFFTLIPEPRDQYINKFDTQINDEFTAFVEQLETLAPQVNLLDLPADILKKLKAMSATLHATDPVQQITRSL